jgi:hypothetical protein
MNKQLQEHARNTLKDGLSKCTEKQQRFFKQMYCFKDLEASIDVAVDNIPEDKLDWAMQQVKRTLNNVAKPNWYPLLGDVAEVDEEFATFTHSQWSGWMKYLFSKCSDEEIETVSSAGETVKITKTGCMIIPKWAVDRWKRQMNTEYKDLPEEEKKTDLEEATKMIQMVLRRFVSYI